MLSTLSWAMSASTASSASRLPWMSLTIARFTGRIADERMTNDQAPMTNDTEARMIGHWDLVIGAFCLPSRHQSVAERIVQLGHGIDFTARFVARILQPPKGHELVIENDVAGPRIAIPRLTHAADVDHHVLLVELVLIAAIL